MRNRNGRFRLCVVLDAALEGWTSMDYVGEMLVDTLRCEHINDISISTVQPWTPRVFGQFPGRGRWARENADRFLARCLIYPAVMMFKRSLFDAFHIVDHSYAHSAHALPAERTGIYCHDLDAVRPLFSRGPWSTYSQLLARSVLRALQRVAVVFYSTAQVRQQIAAHGLLDERKLIHAPYGVAPEFSRSGPSDSQLDRFLPRGRFILHVGSGDPRKRLELLFRSFAALQAREPDLYLVQQGARLTREQGTLVDELGIRNVVVNLPKLSRAALADLYRRASLLVLPSEREGFGLPLIEAMACGTPVLASDIAAFREVGGDAADYCSAHEPAEWATAIHGVLDRTQLESSKAERLRQAARFSWPRHADIIQSAYRALG